MCHCYIQQFSVNDFFKHPILLSDIRGVGIKLHHYILSAPYSLTVTLSSVYPRINVKGGGVHITFGQQCSISVVKQSFSEL